MSLTGLESAIQTALELQLRTGEGMGVAVDLDDDGPFVQWVLTSHGPGAGTSSVLMPNSELVVDLDHGPVERGPRADELLAEGWEPSSQFPTLWSRPGVTTTIDGLVALVRDLLSDAGVDPERAKAFPDADPVGVGGSPVDGRGGVGEPELQTAEHSGSDAWGQVPKPGTQPCPGCGAPMSYQLQECFKCGAELPGVSAHEIDAFRGNTRPQTTGHRSRPCPRCRKPMSPKISQCYHCGETLQRAGASGMPAHEPALPEIPEEAWTDVSSITFRRLGGGANAIVRCGSCKHVWNMPNGLLEDYRLVASKVGRLAGFARALETRGRDVSHRSTRAELSRAVACPSCGSVRPQVAER